MLDCLVLVGLPTAGKSTYAQSIVDMQPERYAIVSRDAIVETLGEAVGARNYDDAWSKVNQRDVDRMLNARIENLVGEGKNLIIDMTNRTAQSRKSLLDKIPKRKYRRVAVVFMVDEPTMLRRNDERKARTGKSIPVNVLKQMQDAFEYPEYKEGFDSILQYV